ncbi:MAG: carboxylesterase, partial [Zetaproteobacteria bacterium]
MLAARRWDTKPNPDAMLVLLHGLGASAEDLAPLAEAIATRARIGMRIVLPEAPARRVTIADGYPMQAWYDIRSLAFTEDEDVSGIRAAIQSVHALLDAETMRGIHPARIVLGGFSQGAALSLAAGLRYRASLAGIVAFSGYLPLADALASELAPEARRTPIWIGHGTEDDLVPVADP